MEAPGAHARLVWQQATITDIVVQTPRVKSFFLKPEGWGRFTAGQHVDVRLTAPDGYQAERSYSIASTPGDETLELVVERLEEGEVSPFFHEVAAVGDAIELRGPIGGHFVWAAADGGPILLAGGGSGVVPLLSILRYRAAAAPETPAVLIYSARNEAEIIFHEELIWRRVEDPNFTLFVTLSRQSAVADGYRKGRIDAGLIAEALAKLGAPPRLSFVCGSNAFVNAASGHLLDSGIAAATVRTERYGGAP